MPFDDKTLPGIARFNLSGRGTIESRYGEKPLLPGVL